MIWIVLTIVFAGVLLYDEITSRKPVGKISITEHKQIHITQSKDIKEIFVYTIEDARANRYREEDMMGFNGGSSKKYYFEYEEAMKIKRLIEGGHLNMRGERIYK